jgi:hypothetical protein
MNGHHPARGRSNIWLTPRFVIDALGVFDLDPAAAPAPRPFPTALEHYVEAEGDGLLRPWFGRIWLNPPYGRAMGRWMHRLAEHGRGTGLIFARTDTSAFRDAVWGRASAALFLHGRMTFLRPDGGEAQNDGGAPSVLVAYGPEDAERLHDSGLAGQFVPIGREVYLFVARRLYSDDEQDGASWREVVEAILRRRGVAMSIQELTDLARRHPKASTNGHVDAKVRQILRDPRFRRTAPSQYELAFPDDERGKIA